MIDFTLISEIQFMDIDYNDAPKFSTASIEYCLYNGRTATPSELEEINKNYDFVNRTLSEYIMNGEYYETIKAFDRVNLDIDKVMNHLNNK